MSWRRRWATSASCCCWGEAGARGSGLEQGAVFGQHGSVNGIGLGALALGAGEVADTSGFDDADGNAGRLQRAHDGLFVTAGGFANDVRGGMTAQVFEKLGVAFGVIGQEVETAREMQLQRELGNVEADIQDVDVVLTHTCGIRATMICGCRAQATVRVWDNGRKWNELYATHHAKAYARGRTFSRAPFLRPVATGRRTPVWLSLSSLPSKTIRKIQDAASINLPTHQEKKICFKPRTIGTNSFPSQRPLPR